MPVRIPRKANLGCGPLDLITQQDRNFMGLQVPADVADWLMVDYFIKGPGITNWDIQDLSQIPDNHLTEIYCSHALEHITHNKVPEVLELWLSKLAPNGKITLIVPDLLYALEQIKTLENDQVPGGIYNEIWGQRSPQSIIYGSQVQPGEFHLSGFTKRTMEYLLEEAGYTDIDVRVRYEIHQMDCVIAQAKKPS